MAEQLKPNGEGGATAQHNVKNTLAEIKKLNWELAPLEKQMEAIREQVREARHNFKGATGISLTYFDQVRKLVSIDDEEARAKAMDDLRLCAEALAPGGQLNWVDALAEGAEKAAAASGKEPAET